MRFPIILITSSIMLTAFIGCYTFKSAAIPPEIETFYINTFDNRSVIIVPNLAADFSELLRTQVRRETRLRYAETDPDATFTGYISSYTITPRAVAQEGAGNLSDLEMTVFVNYEVAHDEDLNWEKSFSFNLPVEAQTNLLDVQQGLLNDLSTQIAEDIFNAAFNNW